ncbi:site-specific DNA-methyltransferase [Ralstonia solanacearum]|uniref:Site-specific DNA-methyltransferase n=1 Tax=Ralstonia solanacearum TaxID=305 RepID=A0AAE3NNS3_RALSL|nr:site-specific DNA-methyltransferase [Ralstonia solanacearum]MBB6580917.1 site-specific DNA-methyltransferase [Ralstonia solanacearum]MDB0524284.1 site-specific DNA-methyltransferase [Ralstonia solanacearum]
MPFLDWINKNQAKGSSRDVPYHLLKQEAVYGSSQENLLIQGDNLLALKALIPFYAGQVKCIFIDPPYNTQSAFEHYDDKLEHSQWLSMMYPRLVLLRDLLAEDGCIWLTIDDNEAHYLKVLMDEVFGRGNFIAEVIWQKRTSRENRAAIGSAHDTVLVFAKKPAVDWKNTRNLLPPNDAGFSNPDNDPRGPWRSIPFSAQGFRPNQMYEIVTPDGTTHSPPKGRCWGATEPEFRRLEREHRVYFPKGGSGKPRIKLFAGEEKGLVPMSIWFSSEVGDTEESKKEILSLFDEESPFGTPKPERLIERVLRIASNPGDLILDSFLGSGTTAAVAHKMGRRYIGIEMGEHARTHCIPRLQKVIDGEQGGISKSVGWEGGGGFRFCTLGEPAFDTDGRINAAVDFATLAAFIWHSEIGRPGQQTFDSPLLGIHNGTAYYLLYNGILGDRRPAGGNVLTHAVLDAIKNLLPHDGPKVVYGETTRFGAARLAAENIEFKQIPYDVTMR